jgi:hypothetical protein
MITRIPAHHHRIGQTVIFRDHGQILSGVVFGRVGGDLLQIAVDDGDRIFEVHQSGVRAEIDPAQVEALENIAKNVLGLETTATRNSDSLDFSEHAVWTLMRGLRAAYEAGVASAMNAV